MKCICALFSLAFSATNLYAAENVEIRLETHGSCSPAIGINHGQVTINCNSKELETKFRTLPDLSNYNNNISQLVSLRNDVTTLNLTLQRMRNSYALETSTIDNLKKSLDILSKEYQTLKRVHVGFRLQLVNKLASMDEIYQNKSTGSVSIMSRAMAESVLDQQFERYYKILILDIDSKIRDNQLEISNLGSRVALLESDVSFLMNAFLEGKLEDNKGFLGISIGGHYLTESWQPSLSIEYELLLPNTEFFGSKGAVLFDLTWLDWQESETFQTLPDAPSAVVENDRESIILSLGGRLYIYSWSLSTHTYVGGLIGQTIEGKDDFFYFGLSLGTEYSTKNRRIAFEFRWEYMPDIDSETVDFNPLGSAEITKNENSEDGYFLGVRISFR